MEENTDLPSVGFVYGTCFYYNFMHDGLSTVGANSAVMIRGKLNGYVSQTHSSAMSRDSVIASRIQIETSGSVGAFGRCTRSDAKFLEA